MGPTDRTKNKGCKSKHKKFHLIKEGLYVEGGRALVQAEGVLESLSRDIQNPPGMGSCVTCATCLSQQRYWSRCTLEFLSNPNNSVKCAGEGDMQ